MDPIRNPYAPGAGTRPPYLAGRDQLIEDFTITIKRSAINNPIQHMLLSGLRGVGKTVLLTEFKLIARHDGGIAEMLTAHPEKTFRDELAVVLPGMLHTMTKTWSKMSADKVGEVAASFLQTVEGGINIGIAQLKYKPAPNAADTGNLRVDLISLFRTIGEEARTQHVSVCLLIDELQNIDDDSISAIMAAMHMINQEQLPIVLVAAGLPTITKTIALSQPYAERMFRITPIGALDREAADKAFTQPVSQFSIQYTPEALEDLYKASEGYPYFVQVYGRHCWEIATETPIDLDDVRAILSRASQELDHSFYESRYERAMNTEKEYLHAMATLGDVNLRTAEIATVLGKPPTAVSATRKGLIEKGLIYAPERGVVTFSVPRMAHYLNQHPERP